MAVEVSATQRERHPVGIESRADLPSESFDGVIIANELLDNLPFRLAVFDEGWREAMVDVDRSGRFVEVLSAPLDPAPQWLPPRPSIGARAPLVDRAHTFVDRRARAGAVRVAHVHRLRRAAHRRAGHASVA